MTRYRNGIVVLLSTVIIGTASVWWWKRKATRVEAMSDPIRITKLLIHPIKSCKGTSLAWSRYTPEGLEHDRKFVIVDAKTLKFITARDTPQLVLIHPEIVEPSGPDSEGILRISFPPSSNVPEVAVPLVPSESRLNEWERVDGVKIWRHSTDGYICEATDADTYPLSPSECLSQYLGKPVHLIMKGPEPRNMGVDPVKMPKIAHLKDASVRFQDMAPVLVTAESSLADVGAKVTMGAQGIGEWAVPGVVGNWSGELVIERFRPNIVLSGTKAWEEDNWEEIEFSGKDSEGHSTSGRMSIVLKCGRCQLPNVDPTTGVRHEAVPFKVLNIYRRIDPIQPSVPCFGVNCAPLDSGIYRVGDIVRVVKKA